jgi:hypothetical protein
MHVPWRTLSTVVEWSIAVSLADGDLHASIAAVICDAAFSVRWCFKEDKMNKGLAIALLVGGIVLAIFGISAADSFGSDVSRFFTGHPTDKAMWMLIGGVVAALVGLFGVMRRGKA